MRQGRGRRNNTLNIFPSRNCRKNKRKRIKYFKGGSLPQIKDRILQISGTTEKREKGRKFPVDFFSKQASTALQFLQFSL